MNEDYSWALALYLIVLACQITAAMCLLAADYFCEWREKWQILSLKYDKEKID